MLYNAMDIVGAKRLCYCGKATQLFLYFRKINVFLPDTDSVVAIEDAGLPTIPIGNALGEFKSELAEGDSIAFWACGGGKYKSHFMQAPYRKPPFF